MLNDDTVAPGEGFGTHPHDNMEIVSIALEGALRHGDSMGNMQELRPGEIQVMSAGTGITHSEMNASREEPVKFLQIWVITDAEGHTPRYNQIELAPAKRNEFRLIVAPEGRGGEHVGWIHQTAWFHTLDLDAGREARYRMNLHGNGAYVFVIEGTAEVAGEPVHALQRVTLDVLAHTPERGSADWQAARSTYLDRFPEAAPMTELGDFRFVVLHVLGARQVAGFGAARTVDADELRLALHD